MPNPSLQKKLSLWKENRAVLGEWIRLNSDAKTMGELLRRFIEVQEGAVRSCAKEIQGRIDIITKEIEPLEKSIVNLTQEHRIRLEWLYGYRLAKQEDKKLLVGSSPPLIRLDGIAEGLEQAKREKQDEKFRQSGYEKHAKSASAEIEE